MLPFLKSKVYRTIPKNNSKIFFEPGIIKLCFIISDSEAQNETYLENLRKISKALNLNFKQQVYIYSIPHGTGFNWIAARSLTSVPLIFLGASLSGLPSAPPNRLFKLDTMDVFVTFSMEEMEKDVGRKTQFWTGIKSIFDEK